MLPTSMSRVPSLDSVSPSASLNSSSSASTHQVHVPSKASPFFVPPPSRRGFRPPTESRPLAGATNPAGVSRETASLFHAVQVVDSGFASAASLHTTHFSASYASSVSLNQLPAAIVAKASGHRGLSNNSFVCEPPRTIAPRPKKERSEKKGVKRALGGLFGRTSSGLTPRVSSISAPIASPVSQASTLPAQGTPLSVGSQVKAQTQRIIAAIRHKLSSKSPKELWPKTWDEYGKRYAQYDIDIEDPPPPPPREASDHSETPTPFDQRAYNAPRPVNEAQRQAIVADLDLLGRRASPNLSFSSLSLSESLSPPDSGSGRIEPAVVSMENHPAFRQIVQKCRELFDTRVGMMTIFDDEKQLFLAASGKELEGFKELPRDVSFCAHAILNEDRGLVVLDSQKDWRFANNLPSTALGARFYAGVPLLAPTFGNPSAPRVSLGTLCVADSRPRDNLPDGLREQLRELAGEATKEVENWVNARMAAKLAVLETSFHSQDSMTVLPAPSSPLPALPMVPADLHTPPLTPTGSYNGSISSSMREIPARRPKTTQEIALPPSPPESLHRSDSFSSTTASSSRRPSTATHDLATNKLALRLISDSPVRGISRELQKVFDTSTKMLARALALPLVYLVSLDLTVNPPTLRLLSSYGLPSPAPSFDPVLHLKALRAPEGGLLYRNARPMLERALAGGPGFAAGILIPVMEVRRTGFVLAGYTHDNDREFGDQDLLFFSRFAEQLETHCTKVGRSSA